MKKLIAVILSMLTLMGITIPAMAVGNVSPSAELVMGQYNLAEELHDAELGIIGENVSADVLERIRVTAGDDDNVSYTVKNMGAVSVGRMVAGDLYTVTATKKFTQEDNTEDFVYAWIAVSWIDNLGTDNELQGVSGGWTPNGRTLSNREVEYGVTSWDGVRTERTKNPTSNAFDYTNINLTGLTIWATSSVESGGYDDNPITVTVKPTIFTGD